MFLRQSVDHSSTRVAGTAATWSVAFLLLCGSFSPSALSQQSTEVLAAATQLVRAGHYDEAISKLKTELRVHPRNPGLRTVEGVAYSLKGDDENALLCLKAALKDAPGFRPALQTAAEILVRRHDAAALPVLEEILKEDPQNATAREMLGLTQAQHGDCGVALSNFALVSAAVQTHPDSLQLQGACLFETAKFGAAAAAFQQLQTLRPKDPNVLYDLALAQSESGDKKAAADTLASLLEQKRDPETLLLASEIAEDQGDTPRAAALLREAIVADPTRASSYVRFAELCMSHESYQAGVDMVSAGISRLPGEATLFLARGLLYGGMAAYDKAEADFRSADQLDPQRGTGAYAVGLVQAQRNDPEKALATVRSALKTHPEDAQLHYLLARLLLDEGATSSSPEFAEATRSAQTAVRLNPKLVAAHDLLAKIYMETGKHALAIEQCRAALALDAGDQNAMYRLMRSLRATGDNSGAQALAKQVGEMHQQTRQQEANRLRYRIEGAQNAAPGNPGAEAPRLP